MGQFLCLRLIDLLLCDVIKVVSTEVSGILFAHFPTVKCITRVVAFFYDTIVVKKKVPVEKES